MSTQQIVVEDAARMQVGELRNIEFGEDDKVLLVRLEEGFVATQPDCTHYGAPLAEGTVKDGRVICPWHHACFALKTGALLDPPGLDGLATYEVTFDDRGAVIHYTDETEQGDVPGKGSDDRVFAVLGAGVAGMHAVEVLRDGGFTGRVVLISAENELPYDRPNNSKDYLSGDAPEEWMHFRDEAFYEERDIERMLGRRVAKVEVQSRTLHFDDDGEPLTVDGLIVATGARALRPDMEGVDLDGVHTLRSLEDSRRIRAAGQGAKKVVVIGGSFIGLETAMSLKKLGVDSVTVVAPESVPLAKVMGEDIGRRIRSVHEENGVSFQLGAKVSSLRGDGSVGSVVLEDGTSLDADFVVFGVGVAPVTELLEGVPLADDGGVEVDETLRAADGVYVAGDIANYPDAHTGRRLRVEHYRTAAQQGRRAAENLLEPREARPFDGVPSFWSAHFDLSIRYLGHVEDWDDIVVDGDVNDDFIAYFVKDGRVLAAAATGRDTDFTAVHHLMRSDEVPTAEELVEQGPQAFLHALKQGAA